MGCAYYYYDSVWDRLGLRILAILIYLITLFFIGICLRWMYVNLPKEHKEEFTHAHVIMFTINPRSYTVETHGNSRLDAEILKAYDNAYRSQVDAFDILSCMYSTVHVLDSSTVKRVGTNETFKVHSLHCASRGYDTEYSTSRLDLYDPSSNTIATTKHDLYANGITVVSEDDRTRTVFNCSAYCKWCKKSFTFTKEVTRK